MIAYSVKIIYLVKLAFVYVVFASRCYSHEFNVYPLLVKCMDLTTHISVELELCSMLSFLQLLAQPTVIKM